MDVSDPDQVFDGVRALASELGTLDRVIVNAGIGKGQPIGTGRFDANLATVRTNFVGALAQCEAAMEIFRANGAGHLVIVSSLAAFRGLPRTATAYGATKAAVRVAGRGPARGDTGEQDPARHQDHHVVPGLHPVRDEPGPQPVGLEDRARRARDDHRDGAGSAQRDGAAVAVGDRRHPDEGVAAVTGRPVFLSASSQTPIAHSCYVDACF